MSGIINVTLPTSRVDCQHFAIVDKPDVPSVPPLVAILFNILLFVLVLADHKLLNRACGNRRLAFLTIVALMVIHALPAVVQALIELVGYAKIYNENYHVFNNLAACLDGIFPRTINLMIPVIVIVVLRLAASIGEFIVVVFGLFEDYRFPTLGVKKRRLVVCVCVLLISTLVGALMFIRIHFSGFGCDYDKDAGRYFCSTQETAKEVNEFFNVSSSELDACDTLNAAVQSSTSPGSAPPQCGNVSTAFSNEVQKHFERVVRIGVSRSFIIASMATAVVSFLSVLANVLFVVYRLWKKADLTLTWMILAVFVSGLQNSLTMFLFVRRELDLEDFTRVVGCGCATDEAVLDWNALLRKMGEFIMSFSVAVTYSKVEKAEKHQESATLQALEG